jgi:asparagine synthase (glutamine-hydrolysing)
MFALAIWDARTQELFLARDRFGKKPLYYSFSVPGVRFCFASELKALTVLPGFRRTLDSQSVADFLSLSYVPDPQTIYRDVFKLNPGHSLTVSPSTHRIRKYWAPDFTGRTSSSFETAVEELRTMASDAVESRLVSDVPLGAFLSGGVDSSAVVAFMAGTAGDRVKTFSIGFTNREYDELEYARLAVSRYHTDHHEQVVSPAIEEIFDPLVEQFDEPFGDSSAVPTMYLSRMTRQHVTVALSGDGADEIFGGYRRYYFGVLEERLRRKFPGWFRQSAIKLAGRYYPKFDYLPRVFRAKTLLSNLAMEIGDAYFTTMSSFRDAGLDAVLSPDLRAGLGGYSPRASFRHRFQAVSHLSPLEQIQAVDLETYLPGDILVKADRASMAYSLEGRAPWMDHRLAELAFRMPEQWKLHGRTGKYIFKRAVAPLVAARVIDRPKQGFAVPLAQWFRSSLKPAFESLVLDSPESDAYYSIAEVRRLWNEHQSGLWNHDRKLWNLLMLSAWDVRHRNPQKDSLMAGVRS